MLLRHSDTKEVGPPEADSGTRLGVGGPEAGLDALLWAGNPWSDGV